MVIYGTILKKLAFSDFYTHRSIHTCTEPPLYVIVTLYMAFIISKYMSLSTPYNYRSTGQKDRFPLFMPQLRLIVPFIMDCRWHSTIVKAAMGPCSGNKKYSNLFDTMQMETVGRDNSSTATSERERSDLKGSNKLFDPHQKFYLNCSAAVVRNHVFFWVDLTVVKIMIFAWAGVGRLSQRNKCFDCISYLRIVVYFWEVVFKSADAQTIVHLPKSSR